MEHLDATKAKSIKIDVTRQTSSKSNTIRETDLSKYERKLLLAVENSDVNTVQRILDEAVSLKVDVNCIDPWGRTALIVAIENDNMDIVTLLLKNHVAVGDAILHAVKHDHVGLVNMLLEYEETHEAQHKNLQKYFGESPSQTFSHEISPLMLACHNDNYPIVRLLLECGYTFEIPHGLACTCKRCRCANHQNSIRHSKERYNTYKALVSPSLICLTSKDPILTAFELAQELLRLSGCEYEYSKQYQELADQLRKFVCELLDQTRSFSELAAILDHVAGAPNQDRLIQELTDISDESETTGTQHQQLTRLKLAVDYGEKVFVAHSHCQQILSLVWFDGVDHINERGPIGTLFIAAMHGVMFPMHATAYLLAPFTKFGRMMELPFIKFVCQTTSYLLFILLLVLDAMRIEDIIRGKSALEQSHMQPPGVIQCAIIVYIVGFLVHDLKCVYRNGIQDFISRAYNLISFAMTAFFLCVIGLRIAAYGTAVRAAANETINEQRQNWDAFDPIIVSEGVYACASILAVLRFTELFTLLHGLGPLMISIGNIMRDILLFFVVYFLVIIAFAIGFQQLLWFYGFMWFQELCKENNLANISTADSPPYGEHSTRCLTQGTEWSNLFNIVQALYWGIFGLVFATDLQNGYDHTFQALLAKLIFGVYMFAAWPLLLNLLIALIIHTYSNVRMQEDIEWKYARARLFIRYFSADETLPIPFNLFPSVAFMMRVARKLRNAIAITFTRDSDRVQQHLQMVRHQIDVISQHQEHYEKIMNEIIQRYLIKRYKCILDSLCNIDDVTELKQEVVMFRQDLLNVMQYNGLDVAKKFMRRNRTKVRKKKQPAFSYYNAKEN